MLIQNVRIYDLVHKKPYMGNIQVKDGRLAAVGATAAPAEGEEVIDGAGLNAYPGFVDAHCHIGLDNFGGPTAGTVDYNERNDACVPQMRGIDSYYPQDKAIPNALAGGVTTVCTGPGSANVIGGTFLAAKMYGNSVKAAVINPAVAMKCAFGENPKRNFGTKSNSSRMSSVSKLREMLFLTRDYLARKEAAGDDILKQPKFDMKLEAMIPVLRREIPLKAHAHRADDILTAVRVAEEFNVRLTLEHCTDGHLIVEELKEANVPVAVGPTLCEVGKPELLNKSWTTPGILAKAGLSVSIITDSPVVPEEFLPLCAGLAVKAGMDPYQALQAITINPAKHIGIEDRVGSLEPGKDADIVLCDGDPLVSTTHIRMVFVDGVRRV